MNTYSTRYVQTALLALLGAAPLCAQTAPASAKPNAAEEAVILSPFQVDASADQGYLVTVEREGSHKPCVVAEWITRRST